jgi:hypothetical protein
MDDAYFQTTPFCGGFTESCLQDITKGVLDPRCPAQHTYDVQGSTTRRPVSMNCIYIKMSCICIIYMEPIYFYTEDNDSIFNSEHEPNCVRHFDRLIEWVWRTKIPEPPIHFSGTNFLDLKMNLPVTSLRPAFLSQQCLSVPSLEPPNRGKVTSLTVKFLQRPHPCFRICILYGERDTRYGEQSEPRQRWENLFIGGKGWGK